MIVYFSYLSCEDCTILKHHPVACEMEIEVVRKKREHRIVQELYRDMTISYLCKKEVWHTHNSGQTLLN